MGTSVVPRRLTKQAIRDHVADRRAWYLYQIAQRLRPVPAVYTPLPEVDWSTDLWVGTNTPPTDRSEQAGLIHVHCEPDQPEDAYGSAWSAIVDLPACCIRPNHSKVIEISLDDLDADGGWIRGGDGGWLLEDAAYHAGRAWEHHLRHQPHPPTDPDTDSDFDDPDDQQPRTVWHSASYRVDRTIRTSPASFGSFPPGYDPNSGGML